MRHTVLSVNSVFVGPRVFRDIQVLLEKMFLGKVECESQGYDTTVFTIDSRDWNQEKHGGYFMIDGTKYCLTPPPKTVAAQTKQSFSPRSKSLLLL